MGQKIYVNGFYDGNVYKGLDLILRNDNDNMISSLDFWSVEEKRMYNYSKTT